MKFEEMLSEIINEVEVPDELSPQSIAQMLKSHSAESESGAERRSAKVVPNVTVLRRNIIIRTAAAAAACAVFAVGLTAYNHSRDEQKEIESPIKYEDVASYDDLYDKYLVIEMNRGDTDKSDSDTPIYDPSDTGTTVPESFRQETIEYSGTVPRDSFTDISAYDFADKDKYGENVSEADIIKSDGKYIYCLKGSTLTIISLETMEIVSTMDSSLDPPIEIYAYGDKLILISGETEEILSSNVPEAENISKTPDVPVGVVPSNSADINSGAPDPNNNIISGGESAIPAGKTVKRINTAVDFYSVSDPANPVHTASYKQNGSYTASRLVDGTLYMVTDYSDYRVKPLDTQADLDGFVPAYYIDEEKFYIAPSDVTVPSNAASTGYTVVSAINTASDGISASVNAILGSDKNVYCSEDTLYLAFSEGGKKKYTVISSFELSERGISYRSSGVVDGTLLGRLSMNEYGGKFRTAAAVTDENGVSSVSLYVLDKNCGIVNSADRLLTGGNAAFVRFEGNYARIFEKDSEKAAAVIDLSKEPPVFVQSSMDGAAYLYSFGSGRLAGVGRSPNGGISLTMYSGGLLLDSIDIPETFSKALYDRRAVLTDAAAGIIGIPVYSCSEFGISNRYYVFSYDETAGFLQKGVIEYVDIDNSLAFERGCIMEEKLYVFGGGRVISARLSDLKVIGSYEY